MYLMAHKPDLGIKNPYALDKDQLTAAVDLLKQQRKYIGEYWSDVVKEVQAFSIREYCRRDHVAGRREYCPYRRREGGHRPPGRGGDGLVRHMDDSSKTKSQNCAYKWLDYIASPKVNAAVAEYFGESPANGKACALTKDPKHCETYHSGDAAYAEKIWYWTTPVADCLDGRKDTKCTDYSEWTKSWTEIKG